MRFYSASAMSVQPHHARGIVVCVKGDCAVDRSAQRWSGGREKKGGRGTSSYLKAPYFLSLRELEMSTATTCVCDQWQSVCELDREREEARLEVVLPVAVGRKAKLCTHKQAQKPQPQAITSSPPSFFNGCRS
jgi:hypothetical protein